MKRLLITLAVVGLATWQAHAGLTGDYFLGAGVAGYNGDGTPNISGVPLTVAGTAPWIPSTLHSDYLALTPSGNEAGPGYDSWYPLGYQNFVAKITSTFSVPSAGTYSFGTFSDDGSALYIDGTLVVNNGQEHAPTALFGTAFLTAGSHNLLVDYYEGQPLFQANLTAYMDARVLPEPSTYLAAMLLLLVFGGNAARGLCKNKTL